MARRRRREVYVFAEGVVTEPEYVDQLKRRQDGFAVKVSDQHGSPERIVRLAIDFKMKSDRDSVAEGLSPAERPVVWCMFDRDRHPNTDALIDKAEAAGVHVCFSHPCFEFWVLLHYEDCAAPMSGSCSEACRRLKKHCQEMVKSFQLAELSGRYGVARKRAQRISAQHAADGHSMPSTRDPSTSVWEFVDFLGVNY
jgi:RloB-like protein